MLALGLAAGGCAEIGSDTATPVESIDTTGGQSGDEPVSGSYDDEPDAGSGTNNGTGFNGGTGQIEGGGSPPPGLPDGGGSSSWLDMTGNLLLAHLDEASGTTLTDASGAGNHLDCSTCPVLGATGKSASAVDFTAAGQSATDASAPAYLNGLSAITVLAWIQSDLRDTDRGFLVGKTPDGADGVLGLRYDATGPSSSINLITASLQVSGAPLTYHSSSHVQTQAWQFVALTWSSGSELKLYLDGDLDVPTQNSAPASGAIDGVTTLLVGKGPLDTATAWDGRVDELAIFNRELSASEIRAIFEHQTMQYSGYYDSDIIDAGGIATWTSLSWVPGAPYGKMQPGSAGTETAYSAHNVDMTGNRLLLRFEESSGATTFVDSSGAAHDGTCAGAACPRAGVVGRVGSGGRFDGTNTVVTIPDHADLRMTGDMSFSAWVDWRNGDPAFGANEFSYILEKGVNDNDNYGFLFYNGKAAFECEDTGNTYRYWETAAGSVVMDGWHHWAVVYDDANNLIKFYKDGIEISSQATTYTCANDQTNPLLIGMQNYGANTMRMAGKMDEIGMWSRALGPSEVTALYQRGVTRLKIQLRACDDSSCSGEFFSGPGGSAYEYYSELINSALGLPTALTLSGVTPSRWAQYRVFLQTDSATYNPGFSSVTLDAP
ncbi:MAG: LamG domain-containing protein [Bdellovibrionales bacterium]|nr:LamG domain-containing protein [Bdellovibrionales bacterium]